MQLISDIWGYITGYKDSTRPATCPSPLSVLYSHPSVIVWFQTEKKTRKITAHQQNNNYYQIVKHLTIKLINKEHHATDVVSLSVFTADTREVICHVIASQTNQSLIYHAGQLVHYSMKSLPDDNVYGSNQSHSRWRHMGDKASDFTSHLIVCLKVCQG